MGERKGIFASTLLSNNLVSAQELEEAINFQMERFSKKEVCIPLGEIFIKKGKLSESLVEKIKNMIIEKLATVKKVLPEESLKRINEKFVNVLLKNNILSISQVGELSKIIETTNTGADIVTIAFHLGFIPFKAYKQLEEYVLQSEPLLSTIKEPFSTAEISAKKEEDNIKKQEEKKRYEKTRIDKFVKHIARSRDHIDVWNYITSRKLSVFDIKGLAKETGKKEKIIRKIIADWEKHGNIKKVQGTTYNFAPSQQDTEDAKLFFKKWTNPTEKSEILRRVLEEEQR